MSFGDFTVLSGLLSAALSVLAFAPYIRDTLFGTTRPLRATWLVWAVLSSMSALSNLAEGASASLAFVMVQAGFTWLIFALSLRFGMGSFLRLPDVLVLIAAAAGLALWFATDSAVWALGIAIAVSAVGGAATIAKTYRAPQSETLSCWMICAAAAACAVLAVGTPDPVLLAYPVYLLVLYTAIITAICLGRARGSAARPNMQDAADNLV